MKFRDVVELAFQRFRTRSLRFVLTILGVGVGIGVVFFLVTLGFGLQEVVIGRIATSESLVTLTVALPEEARELVQINDERITKLRETEFVQDVSPVLALPAEIDYEGLKAQTLTQAVAPNYFNYAGIEATGGELYQGDALDGVVISKTVFRLFGLSETDGLGKEVAINFIVPDNPAAADTENPAADTPVKVINFGRPLRIIGYVESDANTIYVPLKLFDQLEQKSYSEVRVRVDNTEHINPVREELIKQGYTVIALTDTLDQLNKIFRFTQIGLATLGIVALFIASVGMFNTLTISLLERTQEVGILKAIGATNKDVWMIFLFEAVLIGALGGVAGIVSGFVFARMVNIGLNIVAQRFGGQAVNIFHIPWWFVLAILSIAITVGFVTGLYPARRAAHLNPLKALKNE